MAEIIVAKHRNGPDRQAALAFLDHIHEVRQHLIATRGGDVPAPPARRGRLRQRYELVVAMPGLAIVGAQWGDEGKGKVIDLLAEQATSCPLPGRQQRRPHARQRRRDVQVPPDPVGDPLPRQAVRDRQRRGGRPAGAHRGDRRACARGIDLQRPAHLGQRAPDHALPPAARPRGRGAARRAPDRHDPPRHRPRLRRQGGPPRASACRTCSTRRSCARRSPRRWSPSGSMLRPDPKDPSSTCTR